MEDGFADEAGVALVEALTVNKTLHEVTNCKLTFVLKEDHVYRVFYRVGGGGGHQLHLESVTLFSMILDDPNRYISRTIDSCESWVRSALK
jgi:hypothetical protein